jgi:copper oxidase (laccase) domain-containing protein
MERQAARMTMAKSGANQSKIMAVGGSALTGWRGAAVGVLAKPVAKHSRFTEDQIKALLGLALIAYAIYRIAKPVVRAVKS